MVKRSQYVASMVPGFRGLGAKGAGMGSAASEKIHLSRDTSSPTSREYAFLRCAGLEPLKILKVTAHWAVEMGRVRGIYAFVETSRAVYFRRGRRPASA